MPSPSNNQPQFRLASQSPRRAALLHTAGYIFTQQHPPFDDPPTPEFEEDLAAAEIATRLAVRKAQSLANAKPAPLLTLAADTLCVDEAGGLIGKPVDVHDARAILQSFIGKTHRVVTGVALLPADAAPVTFADSATVAINQLEDGELEQYLESKSWEGKAGAYNLFERQSAGWPILTIGDPTTIVGLPMDRLTAALAEFDIHPANPSPLHPA